MKKFLVLVLLSLLGWMNAQQKIVRLDTSKVSSKNQLENNNFYLVDDASKLLYLMKSSDKKFKMVYTFTDWCKPCREKFPQILQFEKEFQQVVDVFYVTDIYRESSYTSTDKYLKSIGCFAPVFCISDNDRFKNAKGKFVYSVYNPEKKKETKADRYTFFTQNLAPKHWFYGYSLVIIYDENDKVVYASTYNETHEQVYEQIRHILGNSSS